MIHLRLVLSILYIIAILLIAGLSAGCASVQQELNPKVYYQHTLLMEINKVKYKGYGVVPKASKYEIKISNPNRGKLDFLKISSCHREYTKSGESGSWSGRFEVQDGVEDSGACLWRVEAFDRKGGKHGFGLFDIHTEQENLIGVIKCNGDMYANTVTMCESREGLIQEISFDRYVRLDKDTQDPRCRLNAPARFKRLKFKLRSRECVYAFMSDDDKLHRLTTVGYEGVLIPAGG